MLIRKSHETGSLMVEVMAVIALLGVMGTMMFRQIQRRNEELDNINMASEIRLVKEATTAYIQANKATLEANNCPAIGDKNVDTTDLPLADIEKFLPDNWISDPDAENGIIHEYQIYLSCYRVNSDAADNRLAMYGTIVPNNPASAASPLPPHFPLRRAARVANLIGADGGVFEYAGNDGEDSRFIGTMGAWEIGCAGDGTCNGWGEDDNFYVATTGMDIYVPEADNTAKDTVAVPHNIAFEKLHSTDYFSVGNGSVNCIRNYNTDDDLFAHESLVAGGVVHQAPNDDIRNPGEGGCDPLFWVGSDSDTGNGHVYVRNNLYVGTALDPAGNGTITLNSTGEIIGRVNSTGKGYKLDAANGEIILFEEVTANVNGQNHTVQVPTMRLKDGRMETNVEAQYYDGDTLTTGVYAVDPAGESLMNDIRLTSRGGARLSDILPDYILKGTQTITDAGNVSRPACPHGYVQAISVTPIRYSQYVKGADLNVNIKTGKSVTAIDGIVGHYHYMNNLHINNLTQAINGSANGTTLTVNGEATNNEGGSVAGTSLTIPE